MKENGCLRLYPNNFYGYICKRTRYIFDQLLGSKENNRIQTEQQLYMNILSSSYSLWNDETISKIAKESPEVSSYLALVDSPEKYNNISGIIDFFEFLFRL